MRPGIPATIDWRIIDITGIPREEEERISELTQPAVDVTETPKPEENTIVLDDTSSSSDDDIVVISEARRAVPFEPETMFVPPIDLRTVSRDHHSRREARLNSRPPVDLTRVTSPAIRRQHSPAWPGRRNLTGYLTDLFFGTGSRHQLTRPEPAIPVLRFEDMEAEEEEEAMTTEELGKQVKLAEIKCGICLDKVTSPASTICGHIFCFNCIKLAQQSSRQCPVCRAKLGPKQYHKLFL